MSSGFSFTLKLNSLPAALGGADWQRSSPDEPGDFRADPQQLGGDLWLRGCSFRSDRRSALGVT